MSDLKGRLPDDLLLGQLRLLRSQGARAGKPWNPNGPQAADKIEAQAARIAELEAEVERLRDKTEGLDSDLRCAVQTAYNRGAVEWSRLNYKSMIPWLEGQANPTGGAG